MWVPSWSEIKVREQGTHKGCPYDPVFSAPNLDCYQAISFDVHLSPYYNRATSDRNEGNPTE